jgi:hypothetical protein
LRAIIFCIEDKVEKEIKDVEFASPKHDKSLHTYDIVIIVTGSLFADVNIYDPKKMEQRNNEIARRYREIYNALRNGSHICILLNDIHDPLFATILSVVSLRFNALDYNSSTPVIKIKKPEFRTFISKYGTCLGTFEPNDTISAICSIIQTRYKSDETYESVVGLTKKMPPGMITFLPFFMTESQRLRSEDISNLVQSLQLHNREVQVEAPQWASDLRLKKEEQIEEELVSLRSKVIEKESMLSALREKKSILWLKGNELRDQCMNVLEDSGIKTIKEDIGEEDFWILEQNEKVVMVEVKGKDHSQKR